MVNILKPGHKIVAVRIIYKDTCLTCGCEFEFDDEYVYERERRLNGYASYYCPHCDTKITKLLSTLESRTEEIEVKGE